MFKLSFDTDNDTFCGEEGDADMLLAIEDTLRDGVRFRYPFAAGEACKGVIMDANGNTIGEWEYFPVKNQPYE